MPATFGRSVGSILQRVPCRKARKAAEVPIRRPELRDALADAKRGNARIVDHWPPYVPLLEPVPQQVPMRIGLPKEGGYWRLKPSADLVDCSVD